MLVFLSQVVFLVGTLDVLFHLLIVRRKAVLDAEEGAGGGRHKLNIASLAQHLVQILTTIVQEREMWSATSYSKRWRV